MFKYTIRIRHNGENKTVMIPSKNRLSNEKLSKRIYRSYPSAEILNISRRLIIDEELEKKCTVGTVSIEDRIEASNSYARGCQ